MRWTLLFFVMIITLLCLTLAVSEDSDADWTVMIYLCGDNDLEEHVDEDLGEIQNSNTNDVDVLVLCDYNETHDGETILYHISGNGQTEVLNEDWVESEMNMGDGENLTEFLDFSLTNYPSTRNCLIFWDHGSSFSGVCTDHHIDQPDETDKIRIREMTEALDATLDTGQTMDIIAFMACSMATTEVCYELSDYAEYVVASEKTAWLWDGYGFIWDLKEIINYMDDHDSPSDVAEKMVENGMDITLDMERRSHTWSAMDTDRLPSLMLDLDTLSGELMRWFPEYYVEICSARLLTEEYKVGQRVDLHHFAQRIEADTSLPQSLRNAAQDVMDAVELAVIEEGHFTGSQLTHGSYYCQSAGDEKDEGPANHSNGLHIYFPINSTSYSTSYRSSSGVREFCDNSLWDEWLDLFTSYIFVDDSNSGFQDGSLKYPFETITGALTVAGSGDTMRVFGGSYAEEITIDSSLSVIGNGSSTTILEGTSGNVVTITADDVMFSGFYVYSYTGEDDIQIEADGAVIGNCTLTTCRGDVIHFQQGNRGTVENCTIRFGDGSGILLAGTDGAVIVNCSIYQNGKYGIELSLSLDAEVSGCDIHHNNEHGIHIMMSENTVIWDSDIHENTGDGVYEVTNSRNTDARFNYWGNWNGPGGSGPGNGDEITENVMYSPWLGEPAGSEPKTYHVDGSGSIQAAVDHALPWDEILVHYATYVENIWVYKTLNISGFMDNPPYPLIDGQNSSDAMYITADSVHVQRLNFTTENGGDDCLEIGGSDEIVQYVTISDCNFVGSRDQGIELSYTAEGTIIQRCAIMNTAKSGVLLKRSNDLVATGNSILGCEILECKRYGIELEEGCRDNAVTSCDISLNTEAGIWDNGQGTSITFCTIRENPKYGVVLEKAEYSSVNDCDILGNGYYGVNEWAAAFQCDAMFNYWGDSNGPGISGPGNGDGVNTIVDYSPWLMYPAGTEPQTYIADESGLIQNAIDHTRNGDTVRVLTGNFTEYIEVNRSINLVGNGSLQYDDSNTFLITGNASDALLITADWVNVTGFHITNGLSGDNAIEIQGDHVTVTDCGIASSGSHAILLQSATHVTITDVKIGNAGGYGIRLAGPFSREGKGKIGGSSDNRIENFSIQDCLEGGILIDANGHRNTIRSGWIMVDGIGVEVRGDHCTIEGLDSVNNGDIAVYCNGSFAPTIVECEIGESFDTGVYLNGANNWTIRNCSISSNAEGGVIAMNSHNGRLIDSEVRWNSESGLYLASSDRALVDNSHLTGNTGSGISVDSSDQCQILDSEINENGDDGVHVSISGDTVINHCMIQDNVDYGVYNPTIALPVNARWNSWGDVSGPGGEGPGTGDEVSENVYYSPWLGYWTTVEVMPLDIGVDNTTKVQLALDHAKKGDSILLSPGIYFENLVIDKEVDLIGDGSGSTIIDGKGKQSVITVLKKGRGILIQGLTVTGSGSGEYDAGVKTFAEGVNLDDVVCSGNSIGLHIIEGFRNNVTDCVFRNNRQGVLIASSTLTRIESCTIAGNDRDGIDNSLSKGTHILRNVLEGNGLGILLRNGSKDCVAHENRIIGNRDFAVRVLNNDDAPFNATHNFWGKDTGPYHKERNPMLRKDGPGGNITDLVEFAPWVDEEGNLIYSQSELEPERESDDWWEIPGFDGIPSMIMVMITVAILFRRTKKGPGKGDR